MSDALRKLRDDERAQNLATPWYIYIMMGAIGVIVVLMVLSEAGVLPL